MNRWLIILFVLLIVGCDHAPTDHTHSELEDIHGCLDSQATNYDASVTIDNNSCAYIDSCGVIDIDITNDCVSDCAGVWGGIAADDNCGTCDIDETNDCEADCFGAWGGDAVELWELCFPVSTMSIDLSSRGLTGEIPVEIGNLTNLTYLNLTHNQLRGEIPPEIGNLTNLEILWLNDNQLTGEIPQEVCDLIESNNLNMDWILNGNNLTNTCE